MGKVDAATWLPEAPRLSGMTARSSFRTYYSAFRAYALAGQPTYARCARSALTAASPPRDETTKPQLHVSVTRVVPIVPRSMRTVGSTMAGGRHSTATRASVRNSGTGRSRTGNCVRLKIGGHAN